MSVITLIRPPTAYPKTTFTSGTPIPSIALAYIAACLEEKNYSVQVIDGLGEGIFEFRKIPSKNIVINGISIDEIVDKMHKAPMLIGITCMFSNEWFYYEYLINKVRSKFPNVPIVIGGEHVTGEWSNIFKVCPAVDFCVTGEGEETICELADAIKNNLPFDKIKGIAFNKNGSAFKTEARGRIKNLDQMPLPAWDKFPIKNYLDAGYSFTTRNRKAMPMLAQRGCPYKCTFCTNPQMWGNNVYMRDPKCVVKEIKLYVEKYGIEHVDFCDIVGVIHPTWTRELLKLMIEENLNVTWIHGAGTRSEILDEEILTLFKKSNALRVFYAPETGSEETIKRIQKKINPQKMMASMKFANSLGISMRASIIFGFPNQTFKEVFQSFLFGIKLIWIGVDDVVVHIFAAHPGTQLYKELLAEGKIDMDQLIKDKKYNDFLLTEVLTNIWGHHSWSHYIPHWTLPFLQYGMMGTLYCLQFLIKPWKLVQVIKRSLILRKPLTLFDHILFNLTFGRKLYNYKTIKIDSYVDDYEKNIHESSATKVSHVG